MITTTRSHTPNQVGGKRARRGFTLAEVMIGASLSVVILAGVTSTFLFLGRSGSNLRNYSDMESQARRALEVFAEDVRQGSAITWNTSTSITLVVNSEIVIYSYTSSTGTFTRTRPSSTQTLITGIAAGTFAFRAYNVTGTELPLATSANLTAAGTSTKQLQLSLEASRTTQTVARATNLVLSARYILRNKIVTA